MEKLKLDVDRLAVESFDAGEAARLPGRGTVAAHSPTGFRCDTYFCSYGSCTGLPC